MLTFRSNKEAVELSRKKSGRWDNPRQRFKIILIHLTFFDTNIIYQIQSHLVSIHNTATFCVGTIFAYYAISVKYGWAIIKCILPHKCNWCLLEGQSADSCGGFYLRRNSKKIKWMVNIIKSLNHQVFPITEARRQ